MSQSSSSSAAVHGSATRKHADQWDVDISALFDDFALSSNYIHAQTVLQKRSTYALRRNRGATQLWVDGQGGWPDFRSRDGRTTRSVVTGIPAGTVVRRSSLTDEAFNPASYPALALLMRSSKPARVASTSSKEAGSERYMSRIAW
jgi:hypothetical protein